MRVWKERRVRERLGRRSAAGCVTRGGCAPLFKIEPEGFVAVMEKRIIPRRGLGQRAEA